MTTQHLVFDDNGAEFDPYSQRFRRYIGSDRTFESTRHFLLAQMGFVHVAPAPRCPQVSFSRSAVSPQAIVGLAYWVADRSIERIAYIDPRAPDQPALLLGQARILEFLGSVKAEEAADGQPQAEPIALTDSRFANLWEPARIVATAHIDLDQRLRALGGLLGDLFVVAERSASTGRYVIKHSGAKLQRYNRLIGTVKVGEPFESLDARIYGQWLADTFAPITPATEPQAQSVRAIVGADRAPVQLRYSRVVIPYAFDGVDHILTGSVVL